MEQVEESELEEKWETSMERSSSTTCDKSRNISAKNSREGREHGVVMEKNRNNVKNVKVLVKNRTGDSVKIMNILVKNKRQRKKHEYIGE